MTFIDLRRQPVLEAESLVDLDHDNGEVVPQAIHSEAASPPESVPVKNDFANVDLLDLSFSSASPPRPPYSQLGYHSAPLQMSQEVKQHANTIDDHNRIRTPTISKVGTIDQPSSGSTHLDTQVTSELVLLSPNQKAAPSFSPLPGFDLRPSELLEVNGTPPDAGDATDISPPATVSNPSSADGDSHTSGVHMQTHCNDQNLSTAEESSDHDTRPNSSTASLRGESSDKVRLQEDVAGDQLQVNGRVTQDLSIGQPVGNTTSSPNNSNEEDERNTITAKKALKQKKSSARDALLAAWYARDLARKKVKGTFTLDSIEALETATSFYNCKRMELQDCMAGGALNEQDSEYFPESSKSDLAAPKHRPAGAEQAYRERLAVEQAVELPNDTDDPVAEDVRKVLDVRTGSKQDEMRQALHIAFKLYGQASATLKRSPTKSSRRVAADFAAAKATLTRAKAYYTRTRDKLEGSFPHDPWLLETYLPNPMG